jgi:hypothetical protein
MKKYLNGSWILIILLFISGCSHTPAPQMIGFYPLDRSSVELPEKHTLVYHEVIELEVANTQRVTDQATRLVYDYGGYVAGSHSWLQEETEIVTLNLVVPTQHYSDFRAKVLNLGRLLRENRSGDMVNDISGNSKSYYLQITLFLIPSQGIISSFISPGWHPGQTFARAFSVLVNISGFLVDGLIWMIVVLGPFILIGWFTLRIIRIRRKSS